VESHCCRRRRFPHPPLLLLSQQLVVIVLVPLAAVGRAITVRAVAEHVPHAARATTAAAAIRCTSRSDRARAAPNLCREMLRTQLAGQRTKSRVEHAVC
jgi:hypothetical protein